MEHRPHFFFDLVDPSTRSASDIREMLGTLPLFESRGAVTMGFNGNEANLVAGLCNVEVARDEPVDFLRLAGELRSVLKVTSVIIHRNRFAVGVRGREEAMVPGPHCSKPRKSTGAGDRFNAGFILALLGGGTLSDCLALGCASAGFFVREARSASRLELLDFLRKWQDGGLSE